MPPATALLPLFFTVTVYVTALPGARLASPGCRAKETLRSLLMAAQVLVVVSQLRPPQSALLLQPQVPPGRQTLPTVSGLQLLVLVGEHWVHVRVFALQIDPLGQSASILQTHCGGDVV